MARWMRILTWLDQDVEIVIRNKPEIVAGITRAYGGFGSRWNSLFFVRPMWYLHPSEPPAMPGGHIELESECY